MHHFGTLTGRTAIAGFYAENVVKFPPRITASSWVTVEPMCVFEMEGRGPESDTVVSNAIDHLTVDEDGRIARLAI